MNKYCTIPLLSIDYVTFMLCTFVLTANIQRARRGLFLVPNPPCLRGTGGSEGENGNFLPSHTLDFVSAEIISI